ncbi:D-hexose-6-phosphate mutarotase [Arsenophonus nasoniae]|uniref:Putative glucose-6-phosphate 1-epimerase n=1 Tax=Arsenophonus nasoniae TaxID=638 RepID=A0AA95GNA2_9GAMM|nr:D-hexose-6-phosphate mutarotase [Arsenophonus nasoniae]WGL99984.1 D-hexose-6-phosphate mutarotase [Arsenophonus nasoniae]
MNDTTLFNLPVREKISSYITLCQLDELPVIIVSHPNVNAAVSLQGAQLLSWQPDGGKDCLWVSKNSLFKKNTAIRGGIPICWPWFGLAAQPSHGFARLQESQLTAHSEHRDCVILTLTLADNEKTKKIWPHEFTLIMRLKLAATCEIEFEYFGTEPATGALHTYLQVSDINKIYIEGLGKHYFDKVADREVYTKETKTYITARTDRIYTESDDCNLVYDKNWQRILEIHHCHHTDIVCWNPGAELSSTIKDMTRDGYKKMLCLETAHISQPMQPAGENPARMSLILGVRSIKMQDVMR